MFTNCSYYATVCINNFTSDTSGYYDGAVGIGYDKQYSNIGYTLELSYSNITKCCSSSQGGGLFLKASRHFGQAKVLFNHLKLSNNKAYTGGGIFAFVQGNDDVTLVISNCVLFNGSATTGGGMYMHGISQSADIAIENTDFVDNSGEETGEMYIFIQTHTEADVTFSMVNSTVHHTNTHSVAIYGVTVLIEGCCINVQFTNTRMTFANILQVGFLHSGTGDILITIVTNGKLSIYWKPCNDSILTVWSVDLDTSEYQAIITATAYFVTVFNPDNGHWSVGMAYPVLVLCTPLLERYSHKCIPLHRWNPVAMFKPLLDAYGGPYKGKYRFWTGVTLMVRLTVTVTFSFTSGKLAVMECLHHQYRCSGYIHILVFLKWRL